MRQELPLDRRYRPFVNEQVGSFTISGTAMPRRIPAAGMDTDGQFLRISEAVKHSVRDQAAFSLLSPIQINVGPDEELRFNFHGPGDDPAAVSFGGYLELESSAQLDVELGGTATGSYDSVSVADALGLSGILDATFFDGFDPVAGDSFDILNWGSISGTFSSIDLPALDASLYWNTADLYTDGRISVQAPTPEPGTFLLIAAALGGALMWKIRCNRYLLLRRESRSSIASSLAAPGGVFTSPVRMALLLRSWPYNSRLAESSGRSVAPSRTIPAKMPRARE